MLLRAWRAFAAWRAGRPFWGGAFTMLAGAEVLWAPLAPLRVVVVQGLAGVASLVVAALLVAMGGLSWAQPQLRSILGVTAVVLALASFLTSNLGGFLVGMVLGVLGGALIFAWTPGAGHTPALKAPVAAAVALALALAWPGARAEAQLTAAAAPFAFAAASMTMGGLAYGGVVDVPTREGPVRALRFTMDSLTITRTRLSAATGGNGGLRVRNPTGPTTLTGGVELYATSISGLLFGVVPVVFSPRTPPPFIPAAARFTVVRATIHYLRADVARLPSLAETVT
jgi:hypothetical protein